MFNQLGVKAQLNLLTFASALLLMALAALIWFSLNLITSSAVGMGLGKDLIADLLPPPLYVLEAELTAQEMKDASLGEQTPRIARLTQLKKDYDDRINYWQSTMLDPKIREQLLGPQKEAADRFWNLVLGEYLDAVKRGDANEIHQIADRVAQAYSLQRAAVDNTVRVSSAFANDKQASFNRTSDYSKWLVLGFAVIGAAISILVMRRVTSNVMLNLGGEPAEMRFAAQQIAAGNLNQPLQLAQGDDNSLQASIERMRQSLQTNISQTRSAADEISSAAKRLSASSSQVTLSSEEQGEAASAMAAAMEQVTVSITHVSDNAESAHGLVTEMSAVSAQGKSLVDQNVEQFGHVAKSVVASNDLMRSLGDKSEQISSIVSAIRDIAEQTNLLALNAAIEAARAGDQGRGFAVVADEVRKLSERTSNSTQEIAAMISAVQQAVLDTMQRMEAQREQVDGGVQLASRTGESIELVQQSSGKVKDAVTEISSALREQSSACNQVAMQVEHIAQMTEQNHSAIAEIATSAYQLEQLAASLQASTGRFKIG